ncbi:MAG: PEP-utilizing enzyme [Patescibacteria group bacterium]|jgi:phosphohistidine swiveling domain-containing protein
MAKAVVTKYQPSITEWFAAIGETSEAEVFRNEDNHKVERLESLFQIAGIPYERPIKLPARALADRTPEFEKILHERGAKLCAIRLVSTRAELPKLRNRGLPLQQCYEEWFLKQTINPDDYNAFICPHSETVKWSATLVVSNELIFGEIIRGLHSQLTQGSTEATLYQFRYDFKNWQWSEEDAEALKTAQRIIDLLRIIDKQKQKELEHSFNATFSNNYLKGYFEFTVWPDDAVYIIDYNRLLPRYISAPSLLQTNVVDDDRVLKGTAAYTGKAEGPVVIVTEENLSSIAFPKGSVLVCDNTDVRFLPFMRCAAAIVTNRGGILSHAAIIARELKVPCIVGTGSATEVLKNGDMVEVDAKNGVVLRLQ